MRQRPMDNAPRSFTLEILIQIYNEAEVLHLLFAALDSTFSPESRASRQLSRVRYVLVDDGSTDESTRSVPDENTAGHARDPHQAVEEFRARKCHHRRPRPCQCRTDCSPR